MPVGRSPESAIEDCTTLNAPGWLVRIVAVKEGEAAVRVAYTPSEAGFSSAHGVASHLFFSDELPAGLEMGGMTALAGTQADRAKRSAALADHGKPMRRDLQREARIPGDAASVLRLPGA